MRYIRALAATVIVLSASLAAADTCVINGVTKTCDILCGSGTCHPTDFTYCDVTVGNGDGTCTICGTGTVANTIIGTDSGDYICGKTGDDVIDGGLGDDSISGGNDDDTINGSDGNDYLYGDGGADTIEGGGGSNEIYGGSGADHLYNDPGMTVSYLGSIVCGGSGADIIDVTGYGHTCIDAGTQQPNTGTDCTYAPPSGAGIHDVATQLNCKNPAGTYYSPARECGCP